MSGEATNIPHVPPDGSNSVVLTTLDKVYNWGRKNSAWPLAFGLACCAIEMMCTWGPRNDVARFGWEWMRPSPRQADLMIISGTVTKKMVPQIVRLYNQMPEPRYVLAMGACATSGGPFKEGYSVVWGIDKFVPVDVYITGCPPRPEALLHGIVKLREKIERQTIRTVPWYRHNYEGYVPIPTLGPDLVDARRVEEIAEKSQSPIATVLATATAPAPRGANDLEKDPGRAQ